MEDQDQPNAQPRQRPVVVGIGALRAALLLVLLSGCAPPGCDGPSGIPPLLSSGPIKLSFEGHDFPTAERPGVRLDACAIASPLLGPDGELIISGSDAVVGVDPDDGAERWRVTLPAPEGERAFVVATPALDDDGRLYVGYHTTSSAAQRRDVNTARLRHRVAVIDAHAHALVDDKPALDLVGELESPNGSGTVSFRPANALLRSDLVIAHPNPDATGRKLYATFGNARDIQPWHGFAFEIDVDSWSISGFIVTTPEADCGPSGVSGSRERICGGGLWAPSGPLLLDDGPDYSLILAPGNGQLDLAREDYANTLMRVGPGLDFDPGCDPDACAGFDPDDPARACVESCADLFVPRVPEGEPDPFTVSRCEGLTMFECWQALDYIGGSTPVRVTSDDGDDALLYPTKDGSVYLVDTAHLGLLHDREQLVPVCGAVPGAPCALDWAGMIVTQPALSHDDDGTPLALVATFMPDDIQPAGVVALRVVHSEDGPRLERKWEWPPRPSVEASTRFRRHPTRIQVRSLQGRDVAFIAETPRDGTPGTLIALDAISGELLDETALSGPGYRFTLPLVTDDAVYLSSCESDEGDGFLEAIPFVVSSESN